jgi:hypothetical protein
MPHDMHPQPAMLQGCCKQWCVNDCPNEMNIQAFMYRISFPSVLATSLSVSWYIQTLDLQIDWTPLGWIETYQTPYIWEVNLHLHP